MNYYTTPNYMNYSYNQYPYVQQQPQQFNMQTPQPAMTSSQVLNGKIVDGEDVVKATEVPIGGYGIFPKADLSEIYLKTWNNNGTTSIAKFKPVVEEKPQIDTTAADDNFTQIMQKINDIENKIDAFIAQPQTPPKQQKGETIKNNGF